MASAWVDATDTGVFDDEPPEPEIPNRAGRAARLAGLPFRCTHTGCWAVPAIPGPCDVHAGCELGEAHPCLDRGDAAADVSSPGHAHLSPAAG